jgi:hypothetical protein
MNQRVGQKRPDRPAGAGTIRSPSSHASLTALASAIGNRAMARLARQAKQPSGGRARRVLARDLDKRHYVWHGKFQMGLKTQKNPGAKSGLMGTITFTPDKDTPDSTKIRLFQAVRLEDLTTGKDYVWTGANAPRTAIQTTADAKKGIEAGWNIDMNPAGVSKRTKKTDAEVSPYYRDYWANPVNSQDGSKQGTVTVDASLWDYPGWSKNCRFSFETVAKAVDTGQVYGTVRWGFTISDAAKGIVDHEYSWGRGAPTATTLAALSSLNEYFGNTGASTAPTT